MKWRGLLEHIKYNFSQEFIWRFQEKPKIRSQQWSCRFRRTEWSLIFTGNCGVYVCIHSLYRWSTKSNGPLASLREAAIFFSVARPLRPYNPPPPPSNSVAIFLRGIVLLSPPLPVSGQATKIITFLRLPLVWRLHLRSSRTPSMEFNNKQGRPQIFNQGGGEQIYRKRNKTQEKRYNTHKDLGSGGGGGVAPSPLLKPAKRLTFISSPLLSHQDRKNDIFTKINKKSCELYFWYNVSIGVPMF